MARRFAKCNFGNLDSTVEDINNNGKVNFEHVQCPLRGECKYEDIICNPQFNSSLSDAEMRVMKLVYDGKSNDDIADSLYLSPHTVKIISNLFTENFVFTRNRNLSSMHTITTFLMINYVK